MDRALEALIEASQLGAAGEPMIRVAAALVAGGWPVFPCGQDKAPLVSGGFKSRSTDLEQIDAWWTTHPDALPAIVPGDQELAALDVDSTEAAAAVDKAGYWQDGGFLVSTAGTSAHFDYHEDTHPPQHIYIRASEQPKIPGVVVRFRSGYVIAPGARRGERVYRVFHVEEPGVWNHTPKEVVTTATSESPGYHRVEEALRHIPNTEETGREAYVGVAHMVFGALGAEGRDLFLDWAARYPGGADRAEDERVWDTLPPSRLGWRELWSQAAMHGFDAGPEIAAQAQDEFGVVQVSGAVPEQVFPVVEETKPKLVRMLTAAMEAKDSIDRSLALMRLRKAGFSQPEIKSMLAEMLTQSAPPSDEGMTLGEWLKSPELLKNPDPAIPYLVWPGLKTILSAREKAGKSTLALAGVAVATKGGVFLNETVAKQRVLWLSEEAPSIIIKRAQLMQCDHENLVVVTMGQNPQGQLKRAMDRWHPAIVVIDTLYRFSGVEGDAENDAGTWMPILLLFDEVTKAGAGLLVLAHSLKHDEEGEYRGSSAIGGFVDAVLAMKKPKVGENLRRISGKGRLHFGKPFAVRKLDNDVFELLRDADVAAGEQLTQEIVDHIRTNPGASASSTSSALHKGKQPVLDVFETLEKEGKIVKCGKGWKLLPVEEEMNT